MLQADGGGQVQDLSEKKTSVLDSALFLIYHDKVRNYRSVL